MKSTSRYSAGKKEDTKKQVKPIKEKHSQVENVLKTGDNELIARAIRNLLKKDENNI